MVLTSAKRTRVFIHLVQNCESFEGKNDKGLEIRNG